MPDAAAVATRLYAVVFDTLQPEHLAEFWSKALDWPTRVSARETGWVHVTRPDAGPDELRELLFLLAPEAKQHKNRLHLDLFSESARHQAEAAERLLDAGARRIDIGQGDVPWEVLADPEGNELCVLEPRETYAGSGPLAAIVVESHDPSSLGRFWTEVAGWPIVADEPGGVALRHPNGRGPHLEFIRSSAPKRDKNRVHLDVAPFAGDDQADEVARLQGLGATPVDIGQQDVPWAVLADIEGNEFCVLRPR